MSDTAARLLEQKRKEAENDARAVALTEEYKSALNDMAHSPAGFMVLRQLVVYTEAMHVPKTLDAARILAHNAKRDVYFTAIRPYLTPDLRAKLEE